jgi:hypothetical protein
MKYSEQLSICEKVMLTKEGAKAHRKYCQTVTIGSGAVATAVALPAALPGGFFAGIGIASAGTAFGANFGAQVVTGAAAGAGAGKTVESFFHYPEASEVGIIVEKKERWWGQSGFDYLVQWEDNKYKTWHLSEHLQKLLS